MTLTSPSSRPGAASAYLGTWELGPKAASISGANGSLPKLSSTVADNGKLIDIYGIQNIDPIGTGFSLFALKTKTSR